MRNLTIALSTLLLSTTNSLAEVNVVVSIKPLHSLVASVMQGVGTPTLLLEGNSSPHTYSLKPSDAEKLQQAQVIFWIGHELEAFLEKPIQSLAQNATALALIETPGIKKLAVRESEHEEGHDHDEHSVDAHIWLDPENAKAMVKVIAATLTEVDPPNAKRYAANAEITLQDLAWLSEDITAMLATGKKQGFIVFHDAYHYFEKRFGVAAAGAIAIHPENPPGAEAIVAMRQRLASGGIGCVFAEPQFDNKLVKVITEGSSVRAETLDPLGADVEPGPLLYWIAMRNLATNMTDCLKG